MKLLILRLLTVASAFALTMFYWSRGPVGIVQAQCDEGAIRAACEDVCGFFICTEICTCTGLCMDCDDGGFSYCLGMCS